MALSQFRGPLVRSYSIFDGINWMFPEIGGKPPKWMIYNGKSIKIDDLGVFPLFLVQHPCVDSIQKVIQKSPKNQPLAAASHPLILRVSRQSDFASFGSMQTSGCHGKT